jgi:hypothetical protein
MARKRIVTVEVALDDLTTLGRSMEIPFEIRSVALKCLAMLSDASDRAIRNALLRAETANRPPLQKSPRAYNPRIRELKDLIKKYKPDLAAQKAAGNAKLGEMFDAWQAELAQLTGKEN